MLLLGLPVGIASFGASEFEICFSMGDYQTSQRAGIIDGTECT